MAVVSTIRFGGGEMTLVLKVLGELTDCFSDSCRFCSAEESLGVLHLSAMFKGKI